MTLVTRTLSNTGAPLCGPGGAALAGVTITFTLVTGAGRQPGDVWDATTHERVASEVSTTTDASGIFSVSLWPNSRGNRATKYLCHVNHSAVSDFTASVDAGATTLSWVDFMASGAALTAAGLTALGTHIADTTAAHAASAVSVSAISGRTATDAQGMLLELSTAIGVAAGATDLGATLSATNIVVTSSTGVDATLPAADGTNAGLMVPAQVTKLSGIATGATANSADATLLARANHTGTQAATTIVEDATHRFATDAEKSTWNAKQAALGFTPENAANKDASGGYAGLTLFKLNLRNAANTITSWFTTAATVARTWTLPDKDGTVAMTSDITGTNSGTNTGDQDLSVLVPKTTTVNGHALSGNVSVTTTDLSLNNLTNDVQTKAAIVPNTAPSAGQLLVGNAGGTAYAPITSSGDVTVNSAGAFAIGAGKVTLAMQANMATASVVYRKTAGSGSPEVQTLTTLKTDLSLNNVDNTSNATERAASATLTNKTIDTAGPNVLKVAGVDISTAWTAYTPTVTAGSGSFTTVSATGRYKQIGKTVFASISVSITDLGTAGFSVNATLPVTAISRGFVAGGRENAVAAVILTGYIDGTQTKVAIQKYDGTFVGGNGYVLQVAIAYEAA